MSTKRRATLLPLFVLGGIIVAGSVLVVGRVASLASQQQPAATNTVEMNRPTAGAFMMGEKLPDFTATAADGSTVRLADLLDGKHFVVINFHHPDCPCAENCGKLIADMEKAGELKDVHVVGILAMAEPRERTMNALARQQREGSVTFPVYLDKGGELVKKFGAKRTPEVWVLDREGRIAYHGAPESTLFPGSTDHRFLLREALVALREGREPAVRQFDSIGCPIEG
jgi:peroxiredoxin